MPNVASYTVVRDTDLTLNGGDNTDSMTFSAPNLTTSTAGADRPILSFKVDPLDDDARVEVFLNALDDAVFGQTYAGDREPSPRCSVTARCSRAAASWS